MPRPKGSKNKPKTVISYEIQAKGLRSEINANQKSVDKLSHEVDALVSSLSAKKKELRSARTRLNRSTKQLTQLESRVGEEKRRQDVTKLLDTLLASGKSVDDLEAAINQL